MSLSEHAQYQSPGTSSPKWNAAIINVINSICASLALTSQNVCCEKGPSISHVFYSFWLSFKSGTTYAYTTPSGKESHNMTLL